MSPKPKNSSKEPSVDPKLQKHAERVFDLLVKNYPNSKCALTFKNPVQMMVSTILSAQCTDKRVNMVTKELYKKYKTVKDFADADIEVLEQAIKSTGFYKNKAKNIQNACRKIISDYNGKVPDNMEELLTLPGIARKTANIILYNSFGTISGVAVDTHVKRLSNRIGLTKNHDPNKIEKDLMQLFPKKEWGHISNLLIDHGRAVCDAKKPKCGQCFLNKICYSAFKFLHFEKKA